jgi:hypothetical protein
MKNQLLIVQTEDEKIKRENIQLKSQKKTLNSKWKTQSIQNEDEKITQEKLHILWLN